MPLARPMAKGVHSDSSSNAWYRAMATKGVDEHRRRWRMSSSGRGCQAIEGARW